jgi:hypothetical protein
MYIGIVFCVLIVFSLHRESLKLILVDEPSLRVFCHTIAPHAWNFHSTLNLGGSERRQRWANARASMTWNECVGGAAGLSAARCCGHRWVMALAPLLMLPHAHPWPCTVLPFLVSLPLHTRLWGRPSMCSPLHQIRSPPSRRLHRIPNNAAQVTRWGFYAASNPCDSIIYDKYLCIEHINLFFDSLSLHSNDMTDRCILWLDCSWFCNFLVHALQLVLQSLGPCISCTQRYIWGTKLISNNKIWSMVLQY